MWYPTHKDEAIKELSEQLPGPKSRKTNLYCAGQSKVKKGTPRLFETSPINAGAMVGREVVHG